ncbi:MAG: phospholipid carrier-dependent glycosyltransferase [Candidatus Promineofilum sp.]|nr:phospholipid carrier-dependent glycosyltransferase [Promineifilum sp.]
MLRTMSARSSRPLLILILSIYLALAVGYGIVTPLFETPDEHLHYFTADFIAREGRLPTTRDPGPMAQESAQPPLYYVLASFIVRAAGGVDDTPLLWANPRSNPEDPLGESLARPPLNVNAFIHGPAEAWPWRGYVLSAHLVRLLSTILGLGTLISIYGAGRVVWPTDPTRALLATAVVAFLPQFAFIHGAVSNDAAITFFSAAAIWQLLRMTNDPLRIANEETAGQGNLSPAGDRLPFVRLLLLGLTIGLAVLSKTAGLLLLAYGVAVLVVWAWHRGGRRPALAVGSLVALPALLLSGWWLWRNWALYGDPTAANQFIRLAGGERPYTLRQVWHDMDRVWTSLFARFGWMNVRPPPWVWLAWSVIAALAVAGALWAVARNRRRPYQFHFSAATLLHPAVILLGWLVVVGLAWLQFMLRTPADQGRLFFPALIPLALGAAYGLSRWPRPWTQLIVLGLALVTSIYSLAVVIPSAYAAPPSIAAVPGQTRSLDIRFPEGLDLLGARVETAEARPGDWVWATLYWRALPDRTDGAPLVYLSLFGRGFERIGLQSGYHGRGNYPATLWPVGEIVADRTAVRVLGDAVAPVEARLTVQLDEALQGIDIGTVKIIPGQWPERVAPVATLGDSIELASATLSTTSAAPAETVELRLRWQVIAAPGPALLHLFVHLGNPAAQPVAQADGPVMGGEYPARLWAAGEVFDETVTLTIPGDLPPGEYPVTIGLYEFDSGARLPLSVGGERLPTDAWTLGSLRIK